MIRLVFALFPSFQVDMGAWLAWSSRLAELGPKNFYSDITWTQYTPGFLYWLLVVGKIGWINPLAIKIPVIVADMVTGYLIWKVVSKSNVRIANFLFIFYVLSPVAIFDGSIWGQIDGLLALAMFGSSYLLLEKKSPYASWAMAGIALLIKPQAIAILPLLLGLTWVRFGLKTMMKSGLVATLVVVLGFYPFYPDNPLGGMLNLIQKMGVSYPYTSLFAFNMWTFVGMWKLDNIVWLGLSYFSWGTLMMGIMFALIFIRYRSYFKKDKEAYLMFALSCFIFFLFPTRVHERYLFPMFAYLFAYAGMMRIKSLYAIAGLATIIYSINLYLPYSYYEQAINPLKNIRLESLIQGITQLLAAIQIGLFAMLWLFPTRNNAKNKIPVILHNGEAVEQG